MGIGFVRAAHEAIIGTTRQKTAARHPGLDVFTKPCVPDMRQAYIGAHGRKDAALWRPCVGGQPRSRLQHACVEPLANPSASSALIAPLLEHLPQRAPVPMSEQSTALRLDSPVAGHCPALRTPLVQRVMGTMALPEAVGKDMDILRHDGL
jgi:hypothetical protein